MEAQKGPSRVEETEEVLESGSARQMVSALERW